MSMNGLLARNNIDTSNLQNSICSENEKFCESVSDLACLCVCVCVCVCVCEREIIEIENENIR